MIQLQKFIRPESASALLAGAVAGCVATAPMTLVMLIAHRYLPMWQKQALPPKKITMNLAKRIGLKKHLDERQREILTWLSHGAYGVGMGTAYGPLSRQIPLPGLLKGTVYGLVVWAGSYLGWLPVMDLPEAATQQPWQRNVLMVAAHLVWGSVTGILMDLLTPRRVKVEPA